MEIEFLTDSDLLTDWILSGREGAFQALVARHGPHVHAAALRVCADPAMAAEVGQLVFILLVRKAKSLSSRKSLSGWLHLAAVLQARNLVRQSKREDRKRQLFHHAMESGSQENPADSQWREIRPVIDEALAALGEKDRETVLLRFARSLTVREIAAILGIATDAAQKRLDRATAKLRAQLIRRGCHTASAGASLAVVLAAGFAAEAQAAVPGFAGVASRVLATGAAPAGGVGTFFSTITMKTTSSLPPALALLLAAAWCGSREYARSAVDRETVLLEKRIAEAPAAAGGAAVSPFGGGGTRKGKRSAADRVGDKSLPIDWREAAEELSLTRLLGSIQTKYSGTLESRLSRMAPEEFTAALREIDALDLPLTAKDAVEEAVVNEFLHRHSEKALAALKDRLNPDTWSGGTINCLSALSRLAAKDPAKAAAWLDGALAEGRLESRTLGGKSEIRRALEGELIGGMFLHDPAGAALRLAALPENERIATAWKIRPPRDEFTREKRVGFAAMIRAALPPEARGKVFGQQAASEVWRGLDKMSAMLDDLGSSGEERAAATEEAAGYWLESRLRNRDFEDGDHETLRQWVRAQAPGSEDHATGAALGRAAEAWAMPFADAAKVAKHYQETTGSDEVMVSFLQTEGAGAHPADALALAGSIQDETRRAAVVRTIQNREEKP